MSTTQALLALAATLLAASALLIAGVLAYVIADALWYALRASRGSR